MDYSGLRVGAVYKPDLKVYVLLFLLFVSSAVSAQSFGVLYGTIRNDYKTITPIVMAAEDYSRVDDYVAVVVSYPLTDRLDIDYFCGSHWGRSGLAAEDELRSIGFSAGRTKLRRHGLQLSYKVWGCKDYVGVSPYVRLDYERNMIQTRGKSGSVAYGPDPNNNFEGVAIVETFEGHQVLPSIGCRVSIRPFWKVWLFADMFYSFGHKTYQRLYFDYSYAGVPQPRAEVHTNGSGLVKAVGIGIRFWDAKKYRNKK